MKSHGDSFFFPPSPCDGGVRAEPGHPPLPDVISLPARPPPPPRRTTGPHYTSARGSRGPAGRCGPRSRTPPPAPARTSPPSELPPHNFAPGRLRRPHTPLQAGQRRGPPRRLLPAGCGARSAARTVPAAPLPGTHLGVSGSGGCRARARPMWLRPRVRAAEAPPAKGAQPAGRLRPSGSGTLSGCRGRQGPRRRLLRRRFLRAGIIAALGTGPGTISPPFAPAPSCRHRARPTPRRRGQSPRASLGRPRRLRACARPRSARREL